MTQLIVGDLCYSWHLAQDDSGMIGTIILIVLAIIGSLMSKKKKVESPEDVARAEREQQGAGRGRMHQRDTESRSTFGVDEKRSAYHGRQERAPGRPLVRPSQARPQAAPPPPGPRSMLGQQQAQWSQQSEPSGGRGPRAAGRPSYVTADELRLAERKARQRVRLLSQKLQSPSQPVVAPAAGAPPMSDALSAAEIGSRRRDKAFAAVGGKLTLAERTAHLNELQRGFVYHEIFSAPRAVRQETSVWDT